jgi:hypothetical protein
VTRLGNMKHAWTKSRVHEHIKKLSSNVQQEVN